MPVYEIKVPGAPFQKSLEAMRVNLQALAGDRLPIAFDTFFNYFALIGNNDSLGKQLRDRGSFRSSGAASYANMGRVISETINDIGPDRRQMTLYIAPVLNAEYTISATDLDITFGNAEILLGIDELPEELGYGTSFVLRRIFWNSAGARYFAEEDGIPDNRLQIFVDVTLSEAVLLAGLRGLPKRSLRPLQLSWRIAEGGCCSGGFEAKEPPEGPLCVNLHAKLVTTANVDVAGLIAAANQIYNTRDVTVHLGTIERLNLPQFFDLEVGRCVSNEFTAEQGELYQHRSHAGPNDICAFFVDSLTSSDGNVIGCAAHPPGIPSLAVMVTGTTQWCLAHEIGHVLGLHHVDASVTDNLMRPVDQYTNPPPDLTPNQGGTARWSQLLFSC